MTFENSLQFAQSLDEKDPLKTYRDKFHIPKINRKDCIYFTGNSLGLQPKSTRQFVEEELLDWEKLGVEGHFHAKKRPWFHYHKFSKEALGKIVGAKPSEVVSMNSLTTNLHLMMVSFYRPSEKKFKIVMEEGAFPSDQYAVESQVKFHGFNPSEAIIEIKPREGEATLKTDDIVNTIEKNADSIALVLFSGVQYYTGQYFDLKSITAAGHKAGAKVGFDLAHAVGNVLVNLNDSGADFAAWCSYKYLNSGPGGVSGIYVNERHANNPDLPRFAGWWGHNEEERFKMEKGFIPMEGADGWQQSNVNVLSSAAHMASLQIFKEAGIDKLRAKSLQLTGFLEYLIKSDLEDSVQILTPKNTEERGCQLSLVVKKDGKKVFDTLTKEGVIADWREPEVIRVAPVPLYNTFEDVFNFYSIMKKVLIE
ncbi:kynureninase [Fulvivirga lutimaris]|uniref:kynureninase n=1 Tax=Fulvivirga lutimaris TaxID=1819566 RepID=UPI0012BBDAB0|nr:kynureninase [Fulvivirga lutimaris]MTI40314.1 kynureninase [Fulvivirga lutimaris]